MTRSVLVVDDEPDIRQLLTMLFDDDERCAQVDAAGDLDTGLRSARAQCPGTIVLDLMFGHRTCAEILPELRATCPNSRIIVFTSSRRTAEQAGVTDLGADVIAQKVSVSFDELIELALTA